MMLLISYTSVAQDTEGEEFKPHGKPILKVFTNFHTGISDSVNDAAFEIRRAYLGYQYHLTKEFEMAIKLDSGGPFDVTEVSLNRRFAYFKNAYLRYTHKDLTTQFGIIDVYQFLLHEKYWAHRYIWK